MRAWNIGWSGDLVKAINPPILGLYSGADPGIPVSEIEALRDRPSYRPVQAADGWKRMQAWFKEYGVAEPGGCHESRPTRRQPLLNSLKLSNRL